MAIKAKAELRSDINANLPDNTTGLITPALDRDLRLDAIDSLIAPSGIVSGAGIAVSNNGDGTVTVSAGGAAAASGIPSFVVESAAQPSDDVLTGVIAGLSDSPPFPSLVYLLTPNVLNRAADDLEMRINGDVSRVRPLVDFRGDALAARDLDPSALYEILATFAPSQQYRMTEPVLPRQQDWDFVVVWVDGSRSPPPAVGTLTPQLVADGTVFTVPDFALPDYLGTESFAWLYFGVPADAPPIYSISGFTGTLPIVDSGETVQVGGVDFLWYRITSRTATSSRTYRVEYGLYS